MSHNTFGHLFRVTTWGESHGPAIGCVVDGCPPRIALSEADLQPWLDRRRPGQSKFTTQRQEPDQVRILSGVFDGVTTGTPIALQIENVDQRSRDYSDIAAKFRPGHADLTYELKYGIRDYRGGGRSSARETAMRVAAGGVARKVLGAGVRIRGALVQIGPHAIDRARWDWDAIDTNPFFCPDPVMARTWEDYLSGVRKSGSSAGAVIELVADGVPPGLGAPIYGKLDADLAGALMSINAVKGVEIGAGFRSVEQLGTEHSDEMTPDGFVSNNAGGILGGISTGQDIVVSIAIKPTSSIRLPRRTIDIEGNAATIETHGRHDPCVGIRATPIAEAFLALVLADHALRHRAQNADVNENVRAIPAAVGRAKGKEEGRNIEDPDPLEA
jgi:chorismate synthase